MFETKFQNVETEKAFNQTHKTRYARSVYNRSHIHVQETNYVINSSYCLFFAGLQAKPSVNSSDIQLMKFMLEPVRGLRRYVLAGRLQDRDALGGQELGRKGP